MRTVYQTTYNMARAHFQANKKISDELIEFIEKYRELHKATRPTKLYKALGFTRQAVNLRLHGKAVKK